MIHSVDASENGLDPFKRSDTPALDVSASEMMLALTRHDMELDRVLKANDRREKRLLEQQVVATHEIKKVEAELIERLARSLDSAVGPFREAVGQRTDRIEAAVLSAAEKTEARILAEIAQIKELAAEPRKHTTFIIGKDWQIGWAGLSGWVALFLVLGSIAGISLIKFTGFGATRIASSLASDEAQLCAIINRRYNVADCMVPGAVKPTSTSHAPRP